MYNKVSSSSDISYSRISWVYLVAASAIKYLDFLFLKFSLSNRLFAVEYSSIWNNAIFATVQRNKTPFFLFGVVIILTVVTLNMETE